jgi:hypothetical protein
MIFIFLDGVGIGDAQSYNPFFRQDFKVLRLVEGNLILTDGTSIKPIDAQLGVAGMPMSASGQTTLFTGINIPKLCNEHKFSFPNSLMRKYIKMHNIFGQLRTLGYSSHFINAYPLHDEIFSNKHITILDNGEFQFSDQVNSALQRMISVTSCMMICNGYRPYNETHLRNETAIYQDYTNLSLIERGLDVPQFSPEKAAAILYRASHSHHLTLYEYFQTDGHGHQCDMDSSLELIGQLDTFLNTLLQLADPAKDTIVLTSDHGNLEDLRNRYHTSNPVPLLAWGAQGDFLRSRIQSIADVTPAIVEFMKTFY